MLPAPFSVLYAATKSFISAFGASLAGEVKPHGIDVCVVHPSPVATRCVGEESVFELRGCVVRGCEMRVYLF